MKKIWFFAGAFFIGFSSPGLAANEFMFIKHISGFMPGATSGAAASIVVSPNAGEITIPDGVSPGAWTSFVVRNEGSQETGSISATLSNTDDFELDASGCTTLSAGRTCSLKVRLNASGNGSFSGEMSVVAAPGGLKKVTLSGTANGFTAMWCWGNNSSGQLGNGTTTSSNVPVKVLADSVGRIVKMVSGSNNACVLNDEGKIWCWGSNNWGQLGNGASANSLVPSAVVDVGKTFVDVSTYNEHACALASDHSLWCWGFNQYGQLGTNSTTSTKMPVAVSGMGSGVSWVDAGYDHTCAIKDGGALCWGANGNGQLGNNSTTQSNVPVQVVGMESGVSMIALGNKQSCALKTDGSIWCWGNASSGYLGTGSTSNILVPAPLQMQVDDVETVYNGDGFFCASRQDKTLWCWGANSYGQFGNGGVTSVKNPVLAAGGMMPQQWSVGRYHLCARKDDGSAWCWGNNSNGRLGNGNTTNQNVPVQVTGMASGVLNVMAGYAYGCVIAQ